MGLKEPLRITFKMTKPNGIMTFAVYPQLRISYQSWGGRFCYQANEGRKKTGRSTEKDQEGKWGKFWKVGSPVKTRETIFRRIRQAHLIEQCRSKEPGEENIKKKKKGGKGNR